MSRTVYYDWQGNEIEPPKADHVPVTNADSIRAMTDEELAKFLHNETVFCAKPDERTGGACILCKGNCDECLLEWLKSPAEGVGGG